MPKRRPIFNFDKELTKARRRCGIYQDPRSYVRFDSKEFLAGVDMVNRRSEVYAKFHNHCAGCQKWVAWETENTMDHIASRGQLGDDSLSNLQLLCPKCHISKHMQVKWSPKASD